ncbi:recombinase family protein [Aliivibrio salmonicida]|uniref:recombinase family protein n=1 Tax=Aliivibrio salmonicida TaxID=40269 RepID=UPI003D0A36DC
MSINTRTAYIYSRVSSEMQVGGDGIRRQIDAARNFIDSINSTNIRDGLPSYVIAGEAITDKGLSAYKGFNTAANGGLGAFLEAAKNGDVERGSLLVVEAVDRISRMPADESRKTFSLFKEYGIDVAIVKFSIIIRHSESTTLESDILITAAMHLAHMESQQKSNRINASFDKKRQLEKEGGEKRTTISRGWMKISEDKKSFELIPDRARVIKRIVDMKISGIGCNRIARILNEEGVPGFKSPTWSEGLIHKYCKSIQLYGAFQPVKHVRTESGTKKENFGEVKEDYYPAVIDKPTFLRLKASFKRSGGNQTGAFSNLFSRLLYCPQCGSAMSYFKPNRGRLKVRCRKQIDKAGCTQRALNYEDIEPRLIKALSGLDYAKINSSSFVDLSDELSTIEAANSELNEAAGLIESQWMDATNVRMIDLLTEKLKNIFSEIENNQKRYNEIAVLQTNYDTSIIDELKLSENKDREKYNNFVRQFVKYIICTDKKQGGVLLVAFKSDVVGELPFFFDDDRNEKAISDIFTTNVAVTTNDTVRMINMSKTSTIYLPILKEITDVKQPADLSDTRERIRYMFAVREAVKRNPDRWSEIANSASVKWKELE